MDISKFVSIGLLAFAMATSSALAGSAVATGNVNVRTGPSTAYKVVDVLARGERVDVQECRSNWCYVEQNGPDGWVSARYLSSTSANNNGNESSPDIGFSFGIGPEGPSFSFSIGTPPSSQASVCFYDNAGYSGNRFCATADTDRRALGAVWNNRISSVRLNRSATVTLCRNYYYGGFCRTLTRSEAALGPFLNNQVSSLHVD